MKSKRPYRKKQRSVLKKFFYVILAILVGLGVGIVSGKKLALVMHWNTSSQLNMNVMGDETGACTPKEYYCPTLGYKFCGSNNSVDYNLVMTCIQTTDSCGKTIRTWQDTFCPSGCTWNGTTAFCNGSTAQTAPQPTSTPTPTLQPTSQPVPKPAASVTCTPKENYCPTLGYKFCGSNNNVDYNLILTCIQTTDSCGKTIRLWQETRCATKCVVGNASTAWCAAQAAPTTKPIPIPTKKPTPTLQPTTSSPALPSPIPEPTLKPCRFYVGWPLYICVLR